MASAIETSHWVVLGWLCSMDLEQSHHHTCGQRHTRMMPGTALPLHGMQYTEPMEVEGAPTWEHLPLLGTVYC